MKFLLLTLFLVSTTRAANKPYGSPDGMRYLSLATCNTRKACSTLSTYLLTTKTQHYLRAVLLLNLTT